MVPTRPPRTRLSPEARMRQILDAAAPMVVEQGAFPIPFDLLGQRVGISKGLVYSYFPSQYVLANRLLEARLQSLLDAGLEVAGSDPDWRKAARACADIYFLEVAHCGALLHILLSDLYLLGRLEPELLARYRQIMLQLARRLRALTGLGARDAVTALQMLAAIPEESGKLVFLNRIEAQLGREIAREMVVGAIEGLGPFPP